MITTLFLTMNEFSARLYDPVSGRGFELYTAEPALQLYTGNWLDVRDAKDGVTYPRCCFGVPALSRLTKSSRISLNGSEARRKIRTDNGLPILYEVNTAMEVYNAPDAQLLIVWLLSVSLFLLLC
jgi:hypothetical protein